MAQVFLDRTDIKAGLPAICMRCGQPATGFHQRIMRWSWLTKWSSAYLFAFYVLLFAPVWEPAQALVGKEAYFWLLIVVGFLPTVIAEFLTQKRFQLNVPYCDAHVKFRAWGNYIFYAAWILAISVLVVLAIIGWFPLLFADDARRPLKFAILAIPFVLIGVGYALRENAITRAEIRALLITDDTVLLAGVSPGFVMALQAKRDYAKGQGPVPSLIP